METNNSWDDVVVRHHPIYSGKHTPSEKFKVEFNHVIKLTPIGFRQPGEFEVYAVPRVGNCIRIHNVAVFNVPGRKRHTVEFEMSLDRKAEGKDIKYVKALDFEGVCKTLTAWFKEVHRIPFRMCVPRVKPLEWKRITVNRWVPTPDPYPFHWTTEGPFL